MSTQLQTFLNKIFFPLDEKCIESYRYQVNNQSLLLRLFTAVFAKPLSAILPRFITAMHLSVVAFALAGTGFYIAQAYKGRYPETTLSAIAATIFLYMIVDSTIPQLAYKRGDRSHFTDFLQHYFHGFAVGFFGLIAASLLTTNEFLYGPIILLVLYFASFASLQEYISENGKVTIERYGPLEALFVIVVLLLVCIPRDIYWPIKTPAYFGMAYLDLIVTVLVFGIVGTSLASIRRSKLYLSPATVTYLASCLLFVVLFSEMENTMLAMICFVLFNSELIGRMVLGRMIYPAEVYPHIIPVVLALIGVCIEPFVWGYQITGYLFALFLIGKNFLLALHAFNTIGDRHQALVI